MLLDRATRKLSLLLDQRDIILSKILEANTCYLPRQRANRIDSME